MCMRLRAFIAQDKIAHLFTFVMGLLDAVFSCAYAKTVDLTIIAATALGALALCTTIAPLTRLRVACWRAWAICRRGWAYVGEDGPYGGERGLYGGEQRGAMSSRQNLWPRRK